MFCETLVDGFRSVFEGFRKVKDVEVFAVALFYLVCLMISSHVVDFILLLERFLIISFNCFILILQPFPDNYLINILTVGVDVYRN